MCSNQLIDIENEPANQNSIALYIHVLHFEKSLFGNSVEYAFVLENLFNKVKYSVVIMVEYCEHKQKNVVE